MKKRISTRRPGSRLVIAASLALMTAATARADYSSTVLADNPLAYYALNPAVDGTDTAPDLTGNGNDGDAVNISAVPGPSAYLTNAAYFNGGAAIDLSQGGNAGLLNFTGPITMEAWAQPSSSSEFGDIIAKGYDASTYQEIVIRVNGPYGANYYGSSGSTGVNGGSQTTNWTYVVLSSDGTNTTLYENGVPVAQTPDTSGSANFGDDWVIGNGSSGGTSRTFNGSISEVAIYNHGLSAQQVLAHYYVGLLNSFPSNSVPIINTPPQSQPSYVGGSVTFTVAAASAYATTNEWLKNGVPIAGQTGASLVLNHLQLTDAGSYSVIVGNKIGTTNSAAATLTVAIPRNLQWSANGNSGVWDNESSPNWVNLADSSTTTFDPGDAVLFDDTPGVPTTLTVNGTVVPSVVTVNSSANNYSISSGSLTGSGKIIKEGSSTLQLFNSGSFSGTVAIAGGSVYAGNNTFSSAAAITVTNGATLDLGGGTFNGYKPVTLSGAGVNNQGALFNSYSDYPGESMNVTLAGDATFGGSARWDFNNGILSGAHNLIIDWSAGAGYGEWNNLVVSNNVQTITLTNNSSLGMKNMDTAFQNPATLFTVDSGSTMTFYNGGYNGSLHIQSGATVNIYTAPSAFSGASITFDNNASWVSYYNSGVEPFSSAVILNGVAHFVIGDHNMAYTGVVSGPGGFVADYYNHDIVFSATNTYTGPTIIGSSGNSPAVALTGNGSIADSSLVFFGGGDPTVVRMDVSGRSDQTFTLAAGQTLAGVGAVDGSLVVSAGAILSPGGTNDTIGITTGANPVGTIASSDNVTLEGTTVFKLDGATNDVVSAAATLSYGGTLNLANISGTALTAGSSFQIFSAASYAGSFASITPASPGAGLAWDTTQLSSGKINVIGGSTNPVFGGTQVINGQLVLTGSGGTAGGTYYVLASPSLTASPSSWTPVATNTFDGSGNFSVTTALSSSVPQLFYRIELAP